MKKIIIIILLLVIFPINVWAKDSIFSINKYKEETLTFIRDGYNDKQKKDGLIVGGYYLNKSEDMDNNNDYQIIVCKYSKSGKVLWKYSYGKTKADKIDELIYTYDENGNVDGYGIILEKTYDEGEEIDQNTIGTTFIKINLEGNLVWEKDTNIGKRERIKKLVSVFKEDKTFDYYMGIGSISSDNKEKSIVVKYDREFNLIWDKELDEDNMHYADIISIQNEGKTDGFALIKEKTGEFEVETASVIRIDSDGNNVGTIKEGIEKYDSYRLGEDINGFLIYGITSDVKLKKGEKSYFILKYNVEGQEEWESIGEIPIDRDKKINLLTTKIDEKVDKYYLEYINPIDAKLEVIELDNEGLFVKKVKKINADYYDIENFLIDGNTLYFVGQINCSEDDSCDYDSNSLFLISDEDKVIEVEDSDSKNILIITILIILGIVGLFIVKRKRNLND